MNRDIKLENTLIDPTLNDDAPTIKICDFGLSKDEKVGRARLIEQIYLQWFAVLFQKVAQLVLELGLPYDLRTCDWTLPKRGWISCSQCLLPGWICTSEADFCCCTCGSALHHSSKTPHTTQCSADMRFVCLAWLLAPCSRNQLGSAPRSLVGTNTYQAPEVIQAKGEAEYDGKVGGS